MNSVVRVFDTHDCSLITLLQTTCLQGETEKQKVPPVVHYGLLHHGLLVLNLLSYGFCRLVKVLKVLR